MPLLKLLITIFENDAVGRELRINDLYLLRAENRDGII